jgi:hypothetical protein
MSNREPWKFNSVFDELGFREKYQGAQNRFACLRSGMLLPSKLMNFSVSPAEHAVVRGFVVFGIVALCGARLLFRGIKKDIVDATSVPNGSRWSWIVGGIVLHIPLIGYTFFAYRQGFFGS